MIRYPNFDHDIVIENKPPIPFCITINRQQAEAAWEAKQRGEEPQPVDIEIEYSDQYTDHQGCEMMRWVFRYIREGLKDTDIADIRKDDERAESHHEQGRDSRPRRRWRVNRSPRRLVYSDPQD